MTRVSDLKVGDLVKFDYIYSNCFLNYRMALYLGESFIYRDDGVTIKNYKVQVVGHPTPTTIDRGLLWHLKVYRKAL
jgi:hypothetical protein